MVKPPSVPAEAVGDPASADPLASTASAPSRPRASPFGEEGRDQSAGLPPGYRLIKRIGRGAFGDVWRAEAPGGVEVAIKIILGSVAHKEAAGRELEALELMRGLRHAYLLPIHAYWQREDRLLIAMGLADGSLGEYVKQRRRSGEPGVSVGELAGYITEAAEAIDYLHSKHVLHKDIKPENILLLGGHVMVADFGLSRVLEASRKLMTASGTGTPAFMAPEIMAQGKVGEASDQYSLAAAYAELRLERSLFKGCNLFELMKEVLTRTPDLEPLPKAEQEVLHQALAKEPSQRFSSCRDFARALQTAVTLAPPSPAPTKRPRGRFATAALVLISIAVTAGALAVLWWLLKAPFTLQRQNPLLIQAGEIKTHDIHVQRGSCSDKICLTFSQVPDHIQIEEKDIPCNHSSVSLEVRANPDAAGSHAITVHASSGGRETNSVLEVKVHRPAYTLPDGWKTTSGARIVAVNDKLYYNSIDVIRDGLPVRFLLIPKVKSDWSAPDTLRDPETYYIMENKVWVGLYRKFAARTGIPVAAGECDVPVTKKKIPINQNERQPVYAMAWEDARNCAEWLGGKLPLPVQLDKASGRYLPPEKQEHRLGAFLAPADALAPPPLALQPVGPMEYDAATRDVSPVYQVRHLSGNGLEWTRMREDNFGYVVLRGKSYRSSSPLLYADIKGANDVASQDGQKGEPDLSFRVVIEPEGLEPNRVTKE